MGTVHSLVSLKGGPGKTTLALTLASAYQEKGERTLLLDADKGQESAAQIVALGAERGLDGVETVQILDSRLLAKQARAFAKDYDRVVIDTPGRLDVVARAAIAASDLVLIPVAPGPAGQLAMGPTIDLVDDWNSYSDGSVCRAVVVLTRIDRTTRVGRNHRPTVEDLLKDRDGPPLLLKSEIRELADHVSAQSEGQSAIDYAPRGDAAEEVRRLVAELKRRRLLGRSKK